MSGPRRRALLPADSARAAGLRYVRAGEPGLRRQRAGRGFAYKDPAGRSVRDPDVLRRIRALAIPPAWRDVWICRSEQGHVQAVGRDARGRKQYRYHARWRALRDETKYGRLLAFGHALPRIRARVERDLERPGLPREKVLATIVRLLDTSLIRIGNTAYARANGSFGLTTLRNRHVDVAGATVRFRFRGKGGKEHTVAVSDPRAARVVKRCQEVPGQELFQFVGDDGTRQVIDSADVNDYLREAAGDTFTAKDFRTWAGTVLAALALGDAQHKGSIRTRRQVKRAIEEVAGQLGNTPTVCRKSYVHPAVVDAYLGGTVCTSETPRSETGRVRRGERFVLALLGAGSQPGAQVVARAA